MCGRYENVFPQEEIFPFLEQSFIDKMSEWKPTVRKIKTENIAPTDRIIAFNNQGKGLQPLEVNWGIKFKADSPLIFNSRIETVKEKPYWKSLFKKNKLLIPMTGFYEWKLEGKKKVPYKIWLPDHKLFFVPALFTPIDGNVHASFITTEPNEFMTNVHKRMPVILTTDYIEKFFSNTIEENLELCKPLSDAEPMEMEPANI